MVIDVRETFGESSEEFETGDLLFVHSNIFWIADLKGIGLTARFLWILDRWNLHEETCRTFKRADYDLQNCFY